VIIEESADAAAIHDYFKKDSYCHDERASSLHRKKNCDKLREADPWYYILLYATDLVQLALCSFVMLLLFADWILFVAPVRLIYINCTVYCTLAPMI
jgi:hypothetical protein